jgi:hypothetical protein
MQLSTADLAMAALARQLADALAAFARSRRDDDKKSIALLHTELCALRRAEQIEPETPPGETQ